MTEVTSLKNILFTVFFIILLFVIFTFFAWLVQSRNLPAIPFIPVNLDAPMIAYSDSVNYPTTSELSVLSAIYGAGYKGNEKGIDVTKLLNSKISNNSILIQVNNENMGNDPYPGVQKTLVVTYSISNKKYLVSVKEGQLLLIPPRPL